MAKATNTLEMDTDTSQSQLMHSTTNATSNGGERSTIQVEGGDNSSIMMDVFRWSRCKKPLPQKVMHSIGIPLPIDHLEVISFPSPPPLLVSPLPLI